MVATTFTLVSGTYVDEQALLSDLDFFMVTTIKGWKRVKVVTDTASDKNVAYYTDGTNPGHYDRFWLRLQATSDDLRFYGMSGFDSNTDTDYDPFGGTESATELPTAGVSGTYWFAANKDAVHVLIERSSDGLSLHGGFGLMLTYYNKLEDPKPFYVFGQTAASQTFGSAIRARAYGPHSWGKAYHTTYSGLARDHEAVHPTLISKGTPNPRNGEPKLIEPVFFTDATFGAYEVHGEIPGLYMCGGTDLTSGSFVTTTSGTPGSAIGQYLVNRHSDDIAWAIGPITISGGG